MKKRTADDQTLNQLEELGYLGSGSHNHERPLLICDVDEVILHLVDPFVEVLQERGFELKSHSFKLTGNVFHRDSGAEATQQEVWAGLTQLFEEQSERQGIVESAADELKNLNEQIDIVFLTNMPHEFGDIRRNYLAQNDMTYPLITNTGSKVPAIEIMQSRSQNPACEVCTHPAAARATPPIAFLQQYWSRPVQQRRQVDLIGHQPW